MEKISIVIFGTLEKIRNLHLNEQKSWMVTDFIPDDVISGINLSRYPVFQLWLIPATLVCSMQIWQHLLMYKDSSWDLFEISLVLRDEFWYAVQNNQNYLW